MDDTYLRGRIVMLALLAAGIAALVLARWLQTRARRIAAAATSWPTVPGEITHSRIITQTAPTGQGHYGKTRSYLVRYVYAVEGRRLKGSMRIMQRKLWPQMQQRYRVKASVDVLYDPDKPRRSTLELRFLDAGTSLAIVLYLLGGVVAVAALYGFSLR